MLLAGCQEKRDPETVVMMIESHPANLDPRVGTDAQSERIDQLLFDGLLYRNEKFELEPSLAESWDSPDPLTYRFHIRHGVRFHNGHLLTAKDVAFTLSSTRDGKVPTVKASSLRLVNSIETPDDYTVIVRLSQPYASFLWSLAQGAIGIVPQGAGKEFARHPVGTGPFQFVRQTQDEEVLVEQNPDYWRGKPPVPRVRFKVVPDATVRALELRKGSADVALNALTADMVRALGGDKRVGVLREPGTIYQYLALNLDDPNLRRREVRQALDCATDREPIIHYLWRDQARPAASVLPPSHWAYDPALKPTPYDPARAIQLLEQAGHQAGPDGVRLRLAIKTSTEETSRQLAAVLQQQWRKIGVALDVRSYEFATFYADIVKGAFQIYTLRWIGANNDPDIFEYCFHSRKFPPNGANRGHYSNPEADRLIDLAQKETGLEKRKRYYYQLQELLNQDLPYLHLWYFDNVVVYNRRLLNMSVLPSGDYDFLKTVRIGGNQARMNTAQDR
jgi:peptide/nickel transport system substrate-binding protein